MKKVRDNIYQLTIPLPKSPLVATTDHLIMGQNGERNLLIDTAFDLEVSRESLLSQLAELKVDLDNTDIFITHMHYDHSGLIYEVQRESNQVFMSKVDGDLLQGAAGVKFDTWKASTNDWLGIPDESALPPNDLRSERFHLTKVEVGEVLKYGGYELVVVDLAGHTPGQIGLWEQEQKFLFAGDHVLNRVTPNISTWDLQTDYLRVYMENLLKVSKLDLEVMYTGHFGPVTEPKKRPLEIITHHEERLEVIFELVTGKKQTPYEIASQIKWVGGQDLSALGAQQTWFASTEVMAHLQYLYFHNRVKREVEGTNVYYYR